MDDKQIEQRLKKDDEFWNGPRLISLLGGTLAVALVVIFVISSLKSGDYTWHPFANDKPYDFSISSW